MKNIPYIAAKEFCEKYEKDQCVILSWDEKSQGVWVTTFGVGDKNSIQATNAGKVLKDYLNIQRLHDCIPTRFEKWNIEKVDRYYYASGRNYDTYKEITYWYESHTMVRKETVREATISVGDKHGLPEWARGITNRRKDLETN
ncbi:MAG TPA: hypothetical protein VLY84_00135 [Dysgonamonadaceae bacterium]|nr:hypothetical protein [Dysgonamonadaceae bacterium]